MDRPPDSSPAPPPGAPRSGHGSRIDDASSHPSAPRLGNEGAPQTSSLTGTARTGAGAGAEAHPGPPTSFAFQSAHDNSQHRYHQQKQQPQPRPALTTTTAVRRKPLPPPSASPSPTLAPYFHADHPLADPGRGRPTPPRAAPHDDDEHETAARDDDDAYAYAYDDEDGDADDASECRTEDDSLIDESRQYGLRASTSSAGLEPRRAPPQQPGAGDSQHLVIRDLDQYPRGISPNVPQSAHFAAFPANRPSTASTTSHHHHNHTNHNRLVADLDASRYSPSTLVHARSSLPAPHSPVTHAAAAHHQKSASHQPVHAHQSHAHAHRPSHSHLNRPSHPSHRKGHRSDAMAPRTGGPAHIQILPPPGGGNGSGGATGSGASTPNAPPTPGKQGIGKISSFFGWKSNSNNNSQQQQQQQQQPASPVVESSPTTISDRSSPAGSPHGTSLSSFPSMAQKPVPAHIDVPRANSHGPAANPTMPPPLPSPMLAAQEESALAGQIAGLEEELRDLSAELAGSIRREMELEDQVERLQRDGPNALEKDRRTSDYYSDSGASGSLATRDPEAKGAEDLEAVKRRGEQERAQLKAEASRRLLEEKGRRKALEETVRQLESHVQEVHHGHAASDTARLDELQAAATKARQQLAETQQQNANYEDLLSALREELQRHADERAELQRHALERDNLRDEVVPQLRMRVEGLEAAVAEHERRGYDQARTEQAHPPLRGSRSPIASIAEEGVRGFGSLDEAAIISPTTPKVGLTRSSSLMRGGTRPLSRSNSITGGGGGASAAPKESRESLADRVKDIEAQRDALHRALRALLDRSRFAAREHARRVRALEAERDRAAAAHTPRRRGYETEVAALRHEIDALRRRADDALEQKWQCEKGLGGLKMDLDRAEQETGSLRALLAANDILVPDAADGGPSALGALKAAAAAAAADTPSADADANTEADNATSESLERAYRELRAAQARSDTLRDESAFHAADAHGLAGQLAASAARTDALAAQVRRQLAANADLRARLSETVGKGEREQAASARRVNGLQARLRELEDMVTAAQQRSEDGLALAEADVREMKGNDRAGLQRLRPGGSAVPTTSRRSSVAASARLGPKSPAFLGPMSATAAGGAESGGASPIGSGSLVGGGGIRSPRPGAPHRSRAGTGAGGASSSASASAAASAGPGAGLGGMSEAMRTEYLEQRVRALERALAEAETEMGEVVQRMNAAQIEVAELQAARDEAMRQTRALQTQVAAESAQVNGLLRFWPSASNSSNNNAAAKQPQQQHARSDSNAAPSTAAPAPATAKAMAPPTLAAHARMPSLSGSVSTSASGPSAAPPTPRPQQPGFAAAGKAPPALGDEDVRPFV